MIGMHLMGDFAFHMLLDTGYWDKDWFGGLGKWFGWVKWFG